MKTELIKLLSTQIFLGNEGIKSKNMNSFFFFLGIDEFMR